MKYIAAWTLKNGTRVENQIYTANAISNLLHNLELWGATNIVIRSEKKEVKHEENDYKWQRDTN